MSFRGGGGDDPSDDATLAADLTDNRLVRADGARGLQNSAWTEDDSGHITAGNASGPAVRNSAASSSVPTICPIRTDTASGIGGAASQVDIITASVSRLQFSTTLGFWYVPPVPASDESQPCGQNTRRWATLYGGGLALDYVITAGANYTADADDFAVVMSAATATLALPAISTVGKGFMLLVRMTGATSRTISPNGADTSDVTSPSQNTDYLLIADNINNNWRSVTI